MTQILFDLEYLDRFLERFGGASPIPLLVGLWPLKSLQLARRLHNEVPGIVVPEPVQDALERAGADAPAVGMELARELLEEAREKAAGVYVVAPFRQPLGVLDLLRLAATQPPVETGPPASRERLRAPDRRGRRSRRSRRRGPRRRSPRRGPARRSRGRPSCRAGRARGSP